MTELTREASANPDGACRTVGDSGGCRVAIVLDGRVPIAPEILGVITGPADITAAFTADRARLLAAQIGHGQLPIQLRIASVDS